MIQRAKTSQNWYCQRMIWGLLSRHRWRRRAAAGSPILLAGGTALIGVAIAVVNQMSNRASFASANPIISWSLIVGAIVGIALLLMQWYAEFRRRTYDPQWVLKFQDDFLCPEMLEYRSQAVKAIRAMNGDVHRLKGNKNVAEVLDFFEDLGFYVQGDQLTPEVTHHAFYYWIFRYYSATKNYIEFQQEQDSLQWASIKALFEITSEVETEKNGSSSITLLNLNSKELQDFFLEEE